MKPYWEQCEDYVCKLIKGKRTPGSGNKSVKGDVRNHSLCIEVKSTITKKITIEKEWLLNLEKEMGSMDVALVVFFPNFEGCAYIPTTSYMDTNWKTISVNKDNLPLSLTTEKYIWTRISLDEL